MAERLNRDPAYDLTRHIITGEMPPLSGSETVRQYDAELDRNDPMDPMTNVLGVSGLTSGNSGSLNEEPAKEPIDLAIASNCFDSPEKGQLAYGPKNTGDVY